MKSYPAYKDSGIEWIGEVPEEWGIAKVKHLADIALGKMLTSEDKGGYFLRPYLRAKNLNWLSVDISDVKSMWFSTQELDSYRLKKGDLLVSEGGEVGRTCIWNDELDECYIQNSVNRVRLGDNSYPRYFLYQFFVAGQKGHFEAIVNQVSIAHLTKEKLSEVTFVVPPLPEQRAIAAYLDRKTAQIDTLIANKRRRLALLAEHRTAIISHAVTRGLDPNTPLKGSGIEWIGEVPEHWEVYKLKWITTLNYGDSLPSQDRQEGDVPVYGSNGIVGTHNRAITQAPCIIVGRKGSFGKVNFSDVPCFPIDTTYFVDASTTSQDLYWLAYLLPLLGLDEHSRDSAVPGLNREDAYANMVPVPPLPEQRAIATYLDEKTAQIDRAVARTERQIARLQEYRTALISAAVTGKIDARQEVSQ